MKKKLSNEFLRHEFSEAEKTTIAISMAQKVAQLQSSEDEKKAIMSDFKSQIDGLQAQINSAATKLNNGYEMQTVECELRPIWEKKVWEIWRLDTAEFVKTKAMTPNDAQLSLP